MNTIPARCPINIVKISKKHYALGLKMTSFLFCLMLLAYPLGKLGRVVVGEQGVGIVNGFLLLWLLHLLLKTCQARKRYG